MIDPKLPEMAVAVAILKSDVGKKLLSPLAEQLGLAGGDLGEIYRYYQKECLEKVFTKWAASRGSKPPLSQDECRRVLPLLQLASMQNDEELQARWAALLESTVTASAGVLPSFGQTLSQLTAEEARFLDRLFAFVSQPRGYLSAHRAGREPFDYATLLKVYDPLLSVMNPAEREVFKDRMTNEQLESYDKLTQAELVVQDLERLGIITHEQIAEPSDRIIAGANPSVLSRTTLRAEYSFTQYGVSFIQAVTPHPVANGKPPQSTTMRS
jgi:hypothetical protein